MLESEGRTGGMLQINKSEINQQLTKRNHQNQGDGHRRILRINESEICN